MSEEIKKKYRALKAVAISGIVNPGEIVELTEAEATNIGIGTYLEEVVDGSDGSAAGSETSSAATDGKGEYANDEGSEQKDTGENNESGSASAGESSEEKTSE